MHVTLDSRAFLRVAIPLTLQFVVFHAIALSDSWMISFLGDEALSGVSLANRITFVILLFSFGVGSTISAYVAQCLEQKHRHSHIKKAFINGVFYTILGVAVTFLIVGRWGSFLLALLSDDPAVLLYGEQYLSIALFSYLPSMLNLLYSMTMRGLKQVNSPFVISFLSLGINIVINYFFIFVLDWGVVGAAWATLLSHSFSFFAFIWVNQRKQVFDFLRISSLSQWRFDIDIHRRLMPLMIPAILNDVIWVLGYVYLNGLFARVDTGEYASYAVADIIQEMSFVLFNGFSNTAAIFVANVIHRGKDYTMALSWILLRITLILGVFTSIALWSFSFVIPHFFPYLSRTDVLQTLLQQMAVLSFFRLFSLFSLVGLMRAAGDTFFAFVLESSTTWLMTVPLIAFFSWYGNGWNISQLYWLFAVEEVIKSLISAWRFLSRRWIHDLTREGPEPSVYSH